MSLFIMISSNLNQISSYEEQDTPGGPIMPASRLPGANDTVDGAAQMHGSLTTGEVDFGTLESGSITANLIKGVIAGDGNGSATVTGATVNGGTAGAGGTLIAQSDIIGSVGAHAGGKVSASGATIHHGASVSATDAGSSVTALALVNDASGNGNAVNNLLSLSAGATATLQDIYSTGGEAMNNTVDGGTLIVNDYNTKNSGAVALQTDTLTISGGGQVQVGAIAIGQRAGEHSQVTVQGAGSQLVYSGTLTVGGAGYGGLTISNGATEHLGGLEIGASPPDPTFGSSAGVVVTGNGTSLAVQNNVVVGDQGLGSFIVTSGATATVGGNLTTANQAISSRALGNLGVGVAAGSTLTVNGLTTIGNAAVDDGSSIGGNLDALGGLVVGGTTGGNANFFISGSTASVQAGGTGFTVGDGGIATVTVEAQATVMANLVDLGEHMAPGRPPSLLTVTGAGSKLNVTTSLNVGVAGFANLSVKSGGAVQSQSGFLGGLQGGGGGVTVTGVGSTWTVASGIAAGDSGNGTLSIFSGGTVNITSGVVDIGVGATGTGSIAVGDAASAFNVNGAPIRVGDAGSGEFDILNGQHFMGAQVDIAEQAGSNGKFDVNNALGTFTNVNVGGGAAAGGTGTLDARNGGKILLTGNLAVWGGGTVSLLQGSAATPDDTAMIIRGATSNQGAFSITGADLELDGSVTGTGTIGIGAFGLAVLKGSVAAGQKVAFQGSDAKLLLTMSRSFSGTLSGYAASDIIDLSDIPYDPGSTIQISGGAVIIHPTAGAAVQLTFDAATLPVNPHFMLGRDAADGGTDLLLASATTMSVAQALANYNANPNGPAVAVGDTTTNVAGNIDALQVMTAHGKLTSITLTDPGDSIAVTAAQVSADAATLALIAGPFNLAVMGGGAALTYSLAGGISDFTISGEASAVITGNSSLDTISLGAGNDTVQAGSGGAYITGNGGDDVLIGGAGGGAAGPGNTIYALGGNDYLQGGAGSSSDVLVATGGGNDTFYGGSGNNYIVGGTSRNVIVGGGGALQSLYGNGANGDYIVGGSSPTASNVLVENGTGSAQLWGGAGDDYIVGGLGNDLLVGGVGTNYLFGGGGDDVLYGGPGANYIFPGPGNDFIWTNPVGVQSTGYIYEGVGTGVDTVADFTPGDGANHDVLVMGAASSGIASFADVQAKAFQAGVYTVLPLSATDQVYLYNVQPFQLTANDFIFT